MGKLFGTDGVRDMANMGNMTAEQALEIGRALAYVCKEYHKDKGTRPRIVIGKDTRLSGYMLETALTAGVTSVGVDVLLLGPLPTPGVAFITQDMRADAGIVISASHNPYHDNGIKIFSRTGYKLPDAEEEKMEELINSHELREFRSTESDIGKAKRIDDAIGRYIVFCKNTFPDGMTLDGIKIVLDCANGASYKVAPIIFSELGADVSAIHVSPNGMNINDNCGSQYTDDLKAKVLETGAEIGLAFDGDADRLIVVDEKGNELSGDQIIAICAKQYKERGLLSKNEVVATVMSNFGFFEAMKKMDIDAAVTQVGDRYVLERMLEDDAVLGGEASGHMIFHNHHTTGDGIIAALQLLSILRETGKPLSELAKIMDIFPQRLINIDVKEKPPVEEIAGLPEATEKAEAELGDKGRVLIRYSGTQHMCRVMVEGPTEEMTNRIAEDLADVVRKSIGC
ncbi:phosphoglucosamine mutase [Tichowtungia aerotolerans]|uniref:Phosphoglucosamine mutase n=1 Tax=Tichowtungia aerotolerans TaxID=2697043 RepID=A0A6P1MBG3_9BACT|nr:phosphoglucosamine mutase [Tichowtungia aerotolerans]QHI69884.1 phosphoglucosamine mutase [Tichowtungia aerotolerans]